MNSAKETKKKISDYQIKDIKDLFLEVLKKISSKIILIEIGNNFMNIGIAKSKKNNLYIKKIFKQDLPQEALDKSIPTDPISLGDFIKQVINEQKLTTNRVALCLPSDACYTRLIEIPEEVNENDSIVFIENPSSGIQIPISLENSDFDIKLTNLPKKKYKNQIYNKYFLTSIPKKNIDNILASIKNANLEICSLQMSHMCIANLLKTEIDKLKENELIISIDLLDEFTQLIIFDNSGPLLIKRLAAIRNYPSIEDLKKINSNKNNNSKGKGKSENYHDLSKLDLKVLLREINESFINFIDKNNLKKTGKIFLSGRNSQHKNLSQIIGENLKMDVSVISPINNFCLKEFSYNPDEITQFSMSRIIGLGLTLLKDKKIKDDSLNKEFIFKSFSYKDNLEKDQNNLNSSKNSTPDKKPIKDQPVAKTKSEVKKNDLIPLPNIKIKDQPAAKTKSEVKKNDLTPLPNIKIKDQPDSNSKKSIDNKDELNKKKDNLENNKSFKIDNSFLQND